VYNMITILSICMAVLRHRIVEGHHQRLKHLKDTTYLFDIKKLFLLCIGGAEIIDGIRYVLKLCGISRREDP